ncbi:hypothetical protein evm_004289 [Chilo suppressalis]|nr:hypothetical protein evm_004289 [Chilo suppressalis]
MMNEENRCNTECSKHARREPQHQRLKVIYFCKDHFDVKPLFTDVGAYKRYTDERNSHTALANITGKMGLTPKVTRAIYEHA